MKLHKKLKTNCIYNIMMISVPQMSQFSKFWSILVKNGQSWKIVIFYYFTKILITQSGNELESWNLARLFNIGVQKNLGTKFLIFEYLWKFGHFCEKFDHFGQKMSKNGQIFKITQKIKNLVPKFFCTPILNNLAKFQLFSSFPDRVIKIFVKW